MLLNDIGRTPDTTLRRINQHLETNYGFKIAEDISNEDLVSIMEQIEDEVIALKIQGDDAKVSPEISKRLLVLEGLKNLQEYAMLQFQSPDLDGVIEHLIDFVVDDFRLSGEHQGHLDRSIDDAMKIYSSSRYRFPEHMIRERVKNGAIAEIQGHGIEETPVDDSSIFEEDDLQEEKWIKTDPNKRGMFNGKSKADVDSEKEKLKKKDAAHPGEVSAADKTKMHELEFASRAKSNKGLEEDLYGNLGKRSGSHGAGYAAEVPDTEKARHAMNALDNPSLSLVDKDDNDQPMVRHPQTGKMMPDPFAAQAAARRKGIVMKERQNLVKNLRRLLETEVSQAEVMMAAKGFAQELQEMIEKIGRLQNEDLPPVTDQMRETYGMESSSAFQTQIYGALQGVMDALYTAKGQVDDAVSNMASTGQVSAQTDMDVPVDGMDDMEDDMGSEDDLDNLADELGTEDEFGAADEEEPLGRSMKSESVVLQRKILEMKKLVAKARKLQEAKKSA